MAQTARNATLETQVKKKSPFPETSIKKVKVNTRGVFVDAEQCPLPPGYIRPSAVQVARRLAKETQLQKTSESAFKKRMAYDDLQKELKGDNIPMPSQMDFFKIKIKEKEKLLYEMIEAGKKELLNKRLKKIEEQHYDNPYDKLV